MFEELLIGFDCREMSNPNAEVANWKHDKSWLLNPNATRFLTINRWEWKSVFVRIEEIPPLVGKGPAYRSSHDVIPIGYATAHGYWYDLNEMLEFLETYPGPYQKPNWVIAASVVQTPEAVFEAQRELSRLAPIADDARPDPEWQLLGYSVEDTGFFNGGLSLQWIDPYQIERRELWGDKLNEYMLFSSQDEAVAYSRWHFEVNPGVGTLCAAGLYLIKVLA